MKISFDGQLFLKGEKTGIGWCADNIIKKIPQYSNHDYELNCFTLGYSEEHVKNIEQYKEQGYKINQCKWFHNAIYRMLWNLFPIPYSMFFGKKSDITLFFNYVIPPGVKGKKVTIVYDMAYKVYPETVRKKTRTLLNLSLEQSCHRADKIITISEFSKSEIVKYLGIPSDKIIVMPMGVDYTLYHPNYSHDEVQRVKNKYGVIGDYFLYLGTLEPRKNIERTILAYTELKKELVNVPKLVLAGRKGWMYDSIFETVKSFKLENDIIFTGYIDASDSPVLMCGAEVFLFPSLYEGFGMPPIEAMACGTPVLVSDVSSLPEVVGDAGILVDPLSVDGIKEGMKKLAVDVELRSVMSIKGIERAKNFTWDSSVKILYDVIEKLYEL